jgi:hypothetical protein
MQRIMYKNLYHPSSIPKLIVGTTNNEQIY